MALRPIAHSVDVPGTPQIAFEWFTRQLAEWWPIAYTFSGAKFESAAIEPRVGGRWYERDRDRTELPWGDVRVYEAGKRLVLGFGIGPDRKPSALKNASEVEITFTAQAEQTRVDLEHRDFERHGEGAEALRAGMDSPEGWPVILAELRRHAERSRHPATQPTEPEIRV